MGKIKSKSNNSTRAITSLVLLFSSLSMISLSIIIYFSVQANRMVSKQYISDITNRTVEKTTYIKSSIETSLKQVCDYGNSGLISFSNTEKLKKLLYPIVKEQLLSGITIVAPNGERYSIQFDGTEHLPNQTDDFDPKTRSWYAPSLENDSIFWTQRYLFHTLQQVGITASSSFNNEKNTDKWVVAFDVLLTDLYQKIREGTPCENGHLFTIRPAIEAESEEFILIKNNTIPIVQTAFSQWKNNPYSKEVFSFPYEGTKWWCSFRNIDSDPTGVWMGILLPESDIVLDISRRRTFLILFGILSLLASFAVAFFISRYFGRTFMPSSPLDPEKSEADIRHLIQKGENRSIEFKSTIRMNLHTKKPGKEIELAWLKGVVAFMNTDGGTLLLGVTDAGDITGIELDVFENEDKCRLHFKNLIGTHIGTEFSQYIRFVLLLIDQKTVGIVFCQRSIQPAFLKNGNKEAFYIRNGPSSDELPVSKALNYIKQRQENP